MAPAFFECLILVGIHSYLGIHVIRRKVIFVDLALAQVAALGTTVGFLFGILPGSTGAYWFSLGFAILGAAVFSLSRFRNEKIPQEAVIGLVYALAAAVAILVIDKAPHGAEHIKELLTGSILWVKWKTIFHAALVYAAVGVFHFIFRDKFLLISDSPEKAYEQGISVRFWDFLFYVSFGIVITHSVGTAGVLLVFVFLVVPAITSIMITEVLWKQLVIGWSMGLVVSVFGLYISYIADLPSGPTVVTFYGAMLLLVALTIFVIKAESKIKALSKIAFGIAVTVAVALIFRLMGGYFRSQNNLAEKLSAGEHAVLAADASNGDIALDEEKIDRMNNTDSLLYLFEHVNDYSVRFEIAKRLSNLEAKTGVRALIDLLKECPFPFIREEIIDEIERFSHRRFGYNSSKDGGQNLKALRRLERWYRETFSSDR
ncbi:MAG: metal ABC transporter permease [Calditrichaeota bacterium]|nr:metal ABC transporter permease [Calditrichota bacterium]